MAFKQVLRRIFMTGNNSTLNAEKKSRNEEKCNAVRYINRHREREGGEGQREKLWRKEGTGE